MSDDDLNHLLGITPEQFAAWQATPRPCCGRPNGSPELERPCREGQCVECYCECGASLGSGWGPVGCPCQEEPPLWQRVKAWFR